MSPNSVDPSARFSCTSGRKTFFKEIFSKFIPMKLFPNNERRSTLSQLMKLMTTLFILACLTCCTIQVEKITEEYLLYETTTELTLSIPEVVPIPSASICFNVFDILNVKKLQEEESRKFSETANETMRKSSEVLIDFPIKKIGRDNNYDSRMRHLITLSQMAKFTPPIDEVLDYCRFRNPGKYSVNRNWGRSCYNQFSVAKYLLQGVMCYKFERVQKQEPEYSESKEQLFPYRNMAYALENPGSFYKLYLNYTHFNQVSLIRLIIHYETWPYLSRAFSETLFRSPDSIQARHRIDVESYYTWVTIKRLEYPYSTKCRNYKSAKTENIRREHSEVSSQAECRNECITESTKKLLGKIPFSTLEVNLKFSHPSPSESDTSSKESYHRSDSISSGDLKQLDHSDLWNETIANGLYGLEKSCDSNCFQDDCSEEFSRTTSTLREFYDYEQVSFRINAPVDPIVGIKHIPRTTFHEFTIYVCSCFGIWLGLSVIHLNPLSPSFCPDSNGDSKYTKILSLITGRQTRPNILTIRPSLIPVPVSGRRNSSLRDIEILRSLRKLTERITAVEKRI